MSFPHPNVTLMLLSMIFQGQHSLGNDNVTGDVARFWLQSLSLSLYSLLSHHNPFPHEGRHRAQLMVRIAMFSILSHLGDLRVIMEFNTAYSPAYTA